MSNTILKQKIKTLGEIQDFLDNEEVFKIIENQAGSGNIIAQTIREALEKKMESIFNERAEEVVTSLEERVNIILSKLEKPQAQGQTQQQPTQATTPDPAPIDEKKQQEKQQELLDHIRRKMSGPISPFA